MRIDSGTFAVGKRTISYLPFGLELAGRLIVPQEIEVRSRV
jgi:hypothetical protein